MTTINEEQSFDIKIPNEETLAAMEDAALGRNVEEWTSVDAFLDSLQANG